MKNKIKILIMIIAVLSVYNESFPQNYEELKIGVFYSFAMNSGSEIQGKVLSFDSFFVLINTKNGMLDIKRENILKIKKADKDFLNDYFSTYKKPVYSNFLSLNLGYVSPESENKNSEYYYYYDPVVELNNGFSLSADYTGFFSRYLGVRAGVSYSVIKNKDYNNSYNIQNYYYSLSRTGGSLYQFILNFDLLAGMFHPEKKINFYGLAGFGVGILNGSEVNRSDYYSNNFNPEYQFLFCYGIGGGITYSFSDKIGLKTEVTYNFVSPSDGFYGYTKQFGIKAGIIFINF